MYRKPASGWPRREQAYERPRGAHLARRWVNREVGRIAAVRGYPIAACSVIEPLFLRASDTGSRVTVVHCVVTAKRDFQWWVNCKDYRCKVVGRG